MQEKNSTFAYHGDGIGFEGLQAIMRLNEALGSPIHMMYDPNIRVGKRALDAGEDLIPQSFLHAFTQYKTLFKPPLETPVGNGFKSINVSTRQMFDLYANIRPAESWEGVSVHRRVNPELMIITEEKSLAPHTLHTTEIGWNTQFWMHKVSYENMLTRAVNAAQASGKKRICVLHKANIVKAYGMLVSTAESFQKVHPELTIDTKIIDDFCMKMVQDPGNYDILVVPYQFENVITSIHAAQMQQKENGDYDSTNLHLYRENTADLYANDAIIDEDIATVTFSLSKKSYKRIVEKAMHEAREAGENKVTFVYDDIYPAYMDGLAYAKEVAAAFNPNMTFECEHVRDYIMRILTSRHASGYVVTTNMLGDILSDLHAGMVGGLGLVGSANVGDEYAMFEAVHGTAPEIAGKGIMNPTGMMMAYIMQLQYFGRHGLALILHQALKDCIKNPATRTGDILSKEEKKIYTPLSTTEFTEAVIACIEIPQVA